MRPSTCVTDTAFRSIASLTRRSVSARISCFDIVCFDMAAFQLIALLGCARPIPRPIRRREPLPAEPRHEPRGAVNLCEAHHVVPLAFMNPRMAWGIETDRGKSPGGMGILDTVQAAETIG